MFVEMGDRWNYDLPDGDMFAPVEHSYGYVRMATPERALCDYLLVTNNPQYEGAYTPNLGAGWDLTVLDMDRLGRLVEAYGIQDLWDDFSTSLAVDQPESHPAPAPRF